MAARWKMATAIFSFGWKTYKFTQVQSRTKHYFGQAQYSTIGTLKYPWIHPWFYSPFWRNKPRHAQSLQTGSVGLVGCWAHVRRKYVDALEENRTLATQAIHYIRKLYKVESDANDAGLTTEERKEKRINESYPLILEFEKWLQDTYLRVLPKSRMGKAI